MYMNSIENGRYVMEKLLDVQRNNVYEFEKNLVDYSGKVKYL